MKRSGTRRPWLQEIILKRALKVRNIKSIISLFQSFTIIYALLPGATRLTLFGACPWLSYSAPSALASRLMPRLRRWRSSLVRASGLGVPAYSAPSALATQTFVQRPLRIV